MSSFTLAAALPFWILGVPLVVAVISWASMPKQRDLAPPDERRNIPR